MEGPEPHFIEEEEFNEKILKHYGLWDVKARPPPRAKGTSVRICLDDSESQIYFLIPSSHTRITRWILM